MNIVSKIEDSSTPNRTEAAKALLTQLRERFPVLADFRPLKLLVHLEVRAALEGVPHIRIADALGWHVNSPRYQKALAKGGPRYNLAGEVAGGDACAPMAPDLMLLRTVRGSNTKFTRGCDPLGNHERLCSGDRGRACFAGTIQIGCRCDDGLDVRGEARRRPGCPFGFG